MSNEKQSFRELVARAIGEASLAWSKKPTGVFDSAKAAELISRICAAEALEPRRCEVCGNLVPRPIGLKSVEPMPHPDAPVLITSAPSEVETADNDEGVEVKING